LVALGQQEKISFGCTRLSISIGARGAVVSFQSQSQFSVSFIDILVIPTQENTSDSELAKQSLQKFQILSLKLPYPKADNQQLTTDNKKKQIIFY